MSIGMNDPKKVAKANALNAMETRSLQVLLKRWNLAAWHCKFNKGGFCQHRQHTICHIDNCIGQIVE